MLVTIGKDSIRWFFVVVEILKRIEIHKINSECETCKLQCGRECGDGGVRRKE